MSKTGLSFYRKSQSLEDMQSERPKSLDEVRKAILKAASEVEREVTELEMLFYDGKQCEEDLRQILPYIRETMVTCQVTYIHAAYQIDEMMEKSNDPDELFKADRESFTVLKDYHRKLLEFVPSRMQELVDSVKIMSDYLNRYCLSFYKDVNQEPYMETAQHYEKKRTEFTAAIKMHISNIPRMGRMYRDRCGLPVKVFGLHTNELARRCDCGDIPMVLVFPEACQNMRNACQGVRKWLAEDEQYAGFIQLDITSLEKVKVRNTKQVREHHEKTCQLDHKLRALNKDIEELEADLERLQRRDKRLHDEVSRLENDIKFMHIDIELKEQERQQLRLDPDINTATEPFQRIASQISDLRYKIPAVTKEIQATKDKMGLLLQRQQHLKAYRETAQELKRDLGKSKSESRKATVTMTRIDKCLKQLREIHLRKTAQDVPKKIFHHMPVARQHHSNQTTVRTGRTKRRARRDTLDKAAHVVAKGISSDWPALYRKLPFYPPRGERVLDDDVDYVVQEQYRTNDAVKATDSLQRWRRMHTRANLTDLKGTLKDMGRADIVDQINESAKPKVKVKPKAKRRWRHYKNVKVAMDKLKGFQPSVGLTYPRISIRMVQQAQMLTASPMQKNDNTAVAVRRWGMGLKLPKLTDTKTGILNGGD